MKANKIKIGVSSCLLGNVVRYDGGHKLDQYLIDSFGQVVEWVTICPEVEAGMPVPREPIQLVNDGVRTRLITIETRKDLTDVLMRWAGGRLEKMEQEGVRGFIFKARSPSCGVHDTELFSSKGKSIGIRPGLFVEVLISRFPSLPVADEEALRDICTRERFLARILP